MGKDRTYSRTVVTVALLAGVLLGVLGTNIFLRRHPNLPSPTAYSAPKPLSTVADSLAVEVNVDSNGRVWDYQILSASKSLPPQIKQLLIFTTFRPATFMGQQASGTATLIFSDVNSTVASRSRSQ